jgi:hypothetical protein
MLRMAGVRALDRFDRVTDVLSAAELATFDDAYREAALPDLAALNSRPQPNPRHTG